MEFWVSVLENNSSSVRGITDQDRLEDEVWVAINGPEVVHCEGIVREAIRVGEGGGHFIRRGGNIKSYGVSKAVDSLVKKPPKVPFMLYIDCAVIFATVRLCIIFLVLSKTMISPVY